MTDRNNLQHIEKKGKSLLSNYMSDEILLYEIKLVNLVNILKKLNVNVTLL